MTRVNKERHLISVKPGDLVLLGRPGVTMPSDWYLGKVLWAEGNDVLVEQRGLSGQLSHREVYSRGDIRAAGSSKFLVGFKARNCKAVQAAQRKVRKAEAALGAAREAVWAKLDEIAEEPAQEAVE